MSLATSPVSFRFTAEDMGKLDQVVLWERNKGPMLMPHLMPNRTSVLRALVERELLRLKEEEDRVAEKLAKAKTAAWDDFDQEAAALEPPKKPSNRIKKSGRKLAARSRKG